MKTGSDAQRGIFLKKNIEWTMLYDIYTDLMQFI